VCTADGVGRLNVTLFRISTNMHTIRTIEGHDTTLVDIVYL
jgi:hypothetical protein